MSSAASSTTSRTLGHSVPHQWDEEKVNRILNVLPNQLCFPQLLLPFYCRNSSQSPPNPLPMTKPSDCANLAPAPTSALFTLQITHSHCHPTKPLKPSAANPSAATHSPLFLCLQTQELEPKTILCGFAE